MNEYRWAAIERYGQRDARQYTGPGDESIELPGIAYPDWQGPTCLIGNNYRALLGPPGANPLFLQLIDSNGPHPRLVRHTKNAKAILITPTAHHALNSHSRPLPRVNDDPP
ncbi:phage tail protein [Xylella fastidiosa subsp. multiplex]|uniref:phage tail protein n=1 Tax=Xylella fastidiosa TaxID=2371 RepID=UPI0035D525A4